MRKLGRLIICGVAAISLSAQAEARPRLLERLLQGQAAEAGSTQNGGAAAKSLQVDGMERSYLLLDGHSGEGRAPLVIVLHGGGGSPETMIPRWEDKARAEGLVIAAPKGIGKNDRMGTWNASGCCGEAVSQGVDDVRFVAAVIDDVAKQIPIDGRRIYVAGFSNGGMLTHRVAIALGNRIAAAAVVSGALFGNESAPRAPVPMLIMHGEQDPVVGFEGGMSQTGFVARAQTLPFEPVRYAVDFWRSANRCTSQPAVTKSPIVTVESSTGCRGNADVVFYDLPQGGHTWPGSGGIGDPSEGGPSTSALNATDIIWDFFSSHTRR